MKKIIACSLPVLSVLLFSGCGTDSIKDAVEEAVEDVTDAVEDVIGDNDDESNPSVDTVKFLVSESTTIEEVACILSNGEESTCYSITINGFPSDREELGPFCPKTSTTAAVDAGKWFDGGVLHDLTGEFVSNLDEFYNDSNWNLLDGDNVKITDTQTACEAAARPDVDVAYNNFCVECDIAYYEETEGGGVSSTYLIPITPVPRSSAGSVGRDSIGITFNGVVLDAAAPAEAILGAYTIAAFDDCVGHVNPFAGYHYHGANHGEGTCPAIAFEADGHGGAFGYAMDGYAIHSMLDENDAEETDLDDCRGHTDETRGYHYHSAGPGENLFIGCYTGETAQTGT